MIKCASGEGYFNRESQSARGCMHFRKAMGILITASIGVALSGGSFAGGLAKAQTTSSQAQGTANKGAPSDDLQRSVKIYEYKMAAKSGPERGEVIYFYKCWMCHNKYTKSAPYLSDLYKRSKLVSGEPVNDSTVAEKIRNGGPKMPSFRYTLNDADMADLQSYFRAGKCCYEEEEPPLNPWYHKQ